MRNIIIDEEFKGLLPALDKDTFALLEENILQNGCRDSLVLWGDILIDGHNRYEICQKHNIPFNTIDKQFDSREEALIWIVSTQISRRNLSPMQLSHYRGIHYRADRQIQGTYERSGHQVKNYHNDSFQKSTARRLAEQYKVSPITIMRDAKVASAIDAIGEASPEARRRILSGESPLDKKALQGLAAKPKEEIAKIAEMIEGGSYAKQGLKPERPENGREPGSASYAVQQLAEEAKRLSDSFQAELRKLIDKDDEKAAKAALRLFIKQLEDLYRE